MPELARILEQMTTKEVLEGMQRLVILDDDYEWDFHVNKVEIARKFQQAVAPTHDTNADFNDHQQNRRATIKILQVLTVLVPSSDLKASFDKLPPVEIFTMLNLSFLLDHVGALLRNDSIEDMPRRNELYHAMLKFVKVMASHKNLFQQLTTERVSTKRSLGLQALATATSPAKLFNTRSTSLEPSLAACASESYKHAKAFRDLASNSAISKDGKSRQDKDSIALCEELISFYRTIRHAAPQAIQNSKPGEDAWIYEDRRISKRTNGCFEEGNCFADKRWQPNKSTLLSLFVSVQAMILGVENPLLNFPGLDDDEKTSELINYKNDYVQSLTVTYAMLWWITQDKAKNSAWGKISAMYWKHKGTQLMKSAERWAQTNKCLKDYCEGSAAGLEIPKGYIDMGLVLKSRL
ncbi:hypothetical protein DL95DRAFT_488864 [Leptodontidium sp. 2 PMI_412]|nr:hypothetical protein DL95DRAFT_488864 [Leptodontidium sp. 2 PMI_412]